MVITSCVLATTLRVSWVCWVSSGRRWDALPHIQPTRPHSAHRRRRSSDAPQSIVRSVSQSGLPSAPALSIHLLDGTLGIRDAYDCLVASDDQNAIAGQRTQRQYKYSYEFNILRFKELTNQLGTIHTECRIKYLVSTNILLVILFEIYLKKKWICVWISLSYSYRWVEFVFWFWVFN